jgi:hypothetical protein
MIVLKWLFVQLWIVKRYTSFTRKIKFCDLQRRHLVSYLYLINSDILYSSFLVYEN